MTMCCGQVTEECFICCSVDGKTPSELSYEMMMHTKTIDYPVLSLAVAYGCGCKTMYAHNKCLVSIDSCPSCRKSIKPRLYIETRYDWYMGFLLQWIKKDTSRISTLNWCAWIYLVGMCMVLWGLSNKWICLSQSVNTCFAIIASLLYGSALYMLSVVNDYLAKYWLYCAKTKICYVFI